MNATSEGASLLRPVAAAERVELIDVLRGFALLGILLVNFQGSIGTRWPALDGGVLAALDLLVSNSFYPLFSFLFGLGFALQLLRARERGAPIASIYLRRMMALLLIATAHTVLIWNGDILLEYALFGLLLIPLHRLPSRGLVAVMLVMLVVNVGREHVSSLMHIDAETGALEQGLRAEENRIASNQTMRAEAAGMGYEATVRDQWREYGATIHRFTNWFWVVGHDIPLIFLLGLWVGRRRLLQEAHRHRRGLAVLAAAGLLATIVGHVYERIDPGISSEVDEIAWWAANYALTAFYVAGIGLLLTGRGNLLARAFRWLGAAGKLGLTNYLMQSIVMTLLFRSYGLGLAEPGATVWLLLDLAFFLAVQVPLSHWWIARYRFGPAEWLWRTITYGERQPMRKPASVPAARPEPAAVG